MCTRSCGRPWISWGRYRDRGVPPNPYPFPYPFTYLVALLRLFIYPDVDTPSLLSPLTLHGNTVPPPLCRCRRRSVVASRPLGLTLTFLCLLLSAFAPAAATTLQNDIDSLPYRKIPFGVEGSRLVPWIHSVVLPMAHAVPISHTVFMDLSSALSHASMPALVAETVCVIYMLSFVQFALGKVSSNFENG